MSNIIVISIIGIIGLLIVLFLFCTYRSVDILPGRKC